MFIFQKFKRGRLTDLDPPRSNYICQIKIPFNPSNFIFLNLTLTKLSKSHNFSAKRPAPNTPHCLTVSWFFKSNAIFCTVSLQKITVPKVWHHGVGFIKLTVVGFIDPTSPAFRFGWHALPIRVNYENIRVSQIVL